MTLAPSDSPALFDAHAGKLTMNKLTDEEIRSLVLDAMRDLNITRDADEQVPLDSESPIYGQDGPLDSLELVALAMDIEDAVAERGFDISLSDEKAMSQQHSPFRDVSSLVAYVRELLAGENDAD